MNDSELIIDRKKMRAEMLATIDDLKHSKSAAKLLLSWKYQIGSVIYRSLYESALISYRRCMTGGSARLWTWKRIWKLEWVLKRKWEDWFKIEAEELLRIGNQVVAHRVSKESWIPLFPNDNIIEMRREYRLDLFPCLITIANNHFENIMREYAKIITSSPL